MSLKNAHISVAVILDIIDRVERRCEVVDGPVTPTLEEMTEAEMRTIYYSAKKAEKLLAKLRGIKRK